MRKLLEKRNTIYGVCAVWIVLFHIFRRISMPYIPVVTNIVGIGNMAVDVFFFFSGLCLSLSAEKHDYRKTGWSMYYNRRFLRVLVPYLIICVPYYLWAAVFEHSGGMIRKAVVFLVNLSSAAFWLRGTQTTWYLYGIVVFYLLFPLLYGFSVKNGRARKVGLLAGLILFAVITAYTPILKNSMIVWARLPIFTIGVFAGTERIRERMPNSLETAAAAITVLLLGWVTSASEISESFTMPQVYRLLLYIPLTLALLVLASRAGGRISVFEWIGGVSLEVYLIHITLLHPFKYYGVIDAVGYGLYLLLPVVALGLAWIVRQIENVVWRGKNTA